VVTRLDIQLETINFVRLVFSQVIETQECLEKTDFRLGDSLSGHPDRYQSARWSSGSSGKVLTKLSKAVLKIRKEFEDNSSRNLNIGFKRSRIPRDHGGLVMLRRFDPRIAESTLFLNPLTNSFTWGGEEDKKA